MHILAGEGERAVGVEECGCTGAYSVQGEVGQGRARGTGVSQDTGEVASVHVLLWCHTTLSWWGCWSAEGSPRTSHPLSPSGICHKVLELHGLTSSGVSSVTVPVQQQQEQVCVLDEDQWSWHYLPHSHCI